MTKEIVEAEINEITLVHKADGKPCNPAAKVTLYKTFDTSLVNIFKKFALNNSKISKNNSLTDEQKIQKQHQNMQFCIEKLSKLAENDNFEEYISNITVKGEEKMPNELDFTKLAKVMSDAFAGGIKPLDDTLKAVVKTQTDTQKSIETLSEEVKKLSKTAETQPETTKVELKTEPEVVETEKVAKTIKKEPEKTEKSEKLTKIEELKKQLEEKTEKLFENDEKYQETKKSLDEYKNAVSSEDPEVKILQKQIEKMEKTQEDINYENGQTLKTLGNQFADILKSINKRLDSQEEEIKKTKKSQVTSKAIAPTVDFSDDVEEKQKLEKNWKDDPASAFEDVDFFGLGSEE